MNSIHVSRRKWVTIQIFGGALLSALLGVLLIKGLAWGEFATYLKDFPASSFALATVVFLAAIVLRAWRWYVLFVHERIGFVRLFLIENAGIGLNNLSPIRVVSEPLQLALITRRGGVSAATGLATLAMEHIMDVFVTALLLGIGVIVLPELRAFSIQLAGAIILSVVSLLIFVLIARGMDTIPGAKRFAFLQRAVSATSELSQVPFRIFLSFVGSVGYWAFVGLSGWIIAKGLGIEVGAAAVVVMFVGSIFFVSAVPSLPGGAVTFEAAVVYSLSFFHIEGEPALAFALIMHAIMFVPSTLVAVLVLPREGIKMFGRKDPTVLVDQSGKQVE